MAKINANRSPAACRGMVSATRSEILLALLALGLSVALVFALASPTHQAPLPDPPSQFVGLVVEVDGEAYMMDPPVGKEGRTVTPLSPTVEGPKRGS